MLCECGCGEKTSIATMTNRKLGHVKGQPVRFVNGGHARRRSACRWVEEDRGYLTPCWIWQRSVHRYGRGYDPRTGRQVKAHRLVYEERIGPIPPKMVLDHLCRVDECVNPEHMEPVTQAENIRRGHAHRRAVLAYLASDEFRLIVGDRASDEIRRVVDEKEAEGDVLDGDAAGHVGGRRDGGLPHDRERVLRGLRQGQPADRPRADDRASRPV